MLRVPVYSTPHTRTHTHTPHTYHAHTPRTHHTHTHTHHAHTHHTHTPHTHTHHMDDGWRYHPKHVRQFPDKINCVTLHLVGYILERFAISFG